jgi:hypothetical protein
MFIFRLSSYIERKKKFAHPLGLLDGLELIKTKIMIKSMLRTFSQKKYYLNLKKKRVLIERKKSYAFVYEILKKLEKFHDAQFNFFYVNPLLS